MPRDVRRKHKGESGKAYKIVEPGGKVVGQSDTAKKAAISASKANKATGHRAPRVRGRGKK